MTRLAEAAIRPCVTAAAMGGRTTIAVTTTIGGASWGAVVGLVVRLGIIAQRVRRQLDLIGIDWCHGGRKETRADRGGGEEGRRRG